MRVNHEWNDEPELMEEVAEALLNAGLQVRSSLEEGSYREDGTVDVVYAGRRFRLLLTEVV